MTSGVVTDDELMTVGELSRRSGLTIKAIREYEGLGLIYSAGGSEAGYRLRDTAPALRPDAGVAKRSPRLSLRTTSVRLGVSPGVCGGARSLDCSGSLNVRSTHGPVLKGADWATLVVQARIYHCLMVRLRIGMHHGRPRAHRDGQQELGGLSAASAAAPAAR